jgi:hypothetical protein
VLDPPEPAQPAPHPSPLSGTRPGYLAAPAFLLPDWYRGTVVADPPGNGPGYWAGAPSAVVADGVIYLAYRLRRPVARGRGYAVMVARSEDGERFETVAMLGSAEFGAESLERPALAVTPDGRWRLYVSCATPGTKHWRVDLVEAAHPAAFQARNARTVLPGSPRTGVKDPVITARDGRWQLWASCHPLEVADAEDRMVTRYATSDNGVQWAWRGTALAGRPGGWDARGVRITSVLHSNGQVLAYYDGRASAAENCEERTGVARGTHGGLFRPLAAQPAAASPHGTGALRYLTVLRLPDGAHRMYYEACRDDGAHELRTEAVPPGAGGRRPTKAATWAFASVE